MKKWAVGYLNFFDNALTVRVVDAEDWKSALKAALRAMDKSDELDDEFPDSIEDAKVEAFNGDWQFDVVEI